MLLSWCVSRGNRVRRSLLIWGCRIPTLSNWMKKRSDSDTKLEKELSLSERQELEQLRSEKREWVLEREILKKGTAFWVKESRV